ncbi:MAG: DUF1552 domain-containing protein [Verrucomicrobiae bacterium]|nr:DUF1552 domain-containing protein [Verrucomicrobiae bacterium]
MDSRAKDSEMSRRGFLRGVGTCLALPALEAFASGAAQAGELATTASGTPLRMAFLYAPNGRVMKNWTPVGHGSDFELSPTLAPFASLKKDIQVFSGFEADQARAHGDGPGGHARANAAFLTGCHPRKTAGSDIRAGVSVDQLAAAQLGTRTRLSSLELGCDHVRSAGRCDSGYACTYQYNISWKTATAPMPAEVNPRLVFERLFGEGMAKDSAKVSARRAEYRASILDYVTDDARRLKKQISSRDGSKIDEYLTSVRELEQRIESAEKFQTAAPPEMAAPAGIPETYREHLRMMFDLMHLAFQTDSTRVATFLMASEASNRGFQDLGIAEGYHHLSHHQNNAEKIEKLKIIDRFYAEEVARFLTQLKSTPEGEGNLLDHSMIVYGCGISDGNAHSNSNLPVLVGGRAGGRWATGRHVSFERPIPITNLYLTMLHEMGIAADGFGDSTGVLAM